MTSNDLFIAAAVAWYFAVLALFTCYAQQNSQPARLPEEVRDVEAH